MVASRWILAVLVLSLHAGCYRTYSAESESMVPTLLPGDHFFVNVFAYLSRAPERCEVVLLRLARDGNQVFPPDMRPGWKTEWFVSRVVGLPGEVVSVDAGVVTVNGFALGLRPTEESYSASRGVRAPLFEHDCGDRSIRVAIDPSGSRGDMPPMEIQPDRYLLISDFRTHAYDGRTYGTLHRNDVIGPATRLYYSAPPDAWSVRWERLFRTVE